MAKLLLRFKGQIIEEITLEEQSITIGRTDDNDIMIDNLAVSRNHAKIYKKGEDFLVEDMGSQNGTCVNNQIIHAQHKLQNKDSISIGKHDLIFLANASANDFSDMQTLKSKLGPLRPPQGGKFLPPEETLRLGSGANKKQAKADAPANSLGRVEILEGSGPKEIIFDKVLILAGKGENVNIPIDGDYETEVVFIISNRPTGFFISPPKEIDLEVDYERVSEAIKLKNGSIIQAGNTKMKFYTR